MFEGKQITGKQARKLVEKGALLFDVRDPVSFRNGTIPGATNLSLRQLFLIMKHPKDTALIFFSDENTVVERQAAVNYAFQYGFTRIYDMGDITNWNEKS